MRLFIDTADTAEIRRYAALGILDGVTTNPSLVADSGRDFADVIREICGIVDGPVSAEVTAVDAEAMVEEGRALAGIHPNVVVKVPCMPEGLKACARLRADGIRVNVTLVFSANQALLAAKCGATFVSPFIGRLDDIGQCGMDLIRDIQQIFDNYPHLGTELLVASVRHPDHVREAALVGAAIATCPPKVLAALVKHPLTDAGLEKFLADWRAAQRPRAVKAR